MKKTLSYFVNTIYFSLIILITFTIATVALTNKVNDARKLYQQGIIGTVTKKEIPILSFSGGVVKTVNVRVGQEIKKNDLLIAIDNPVLSGKVQALQKHPDNISAQTEAEVAQEELKGLNIYSSVNGIVTEVTVSEGSPIEQLAKVLSVYSNDNVSLLAYLNDDEFQKVQQTQEATAYSTRLNQNFTIVPDVLNPEEKVNNANEKKIGLFFKFKNKNDGISLLNNEDLEIKLSKANEQTVKPIDFFVNFWNSILITHKK